MLNDGLREFWCEILLRLEQQGNSCHPKSGATRNKRILEDFRMKYNRNDAAKNAKNEAGNRKRALLRVGSAVLCAAVVGTMFGAVDNLG